LGEWKKLKVHIEFGEAKVDFEGDADQVFESIVSFLSQVYPNLEMVRKIVYTPDLTRLVKKLAGLVEITPEGPVIVSGVDLSARMAICLVLLGAHIGSRLGRLLKDSLPSGDLSKLTGKAKKTISNELPRLIGEGLVEKRTEGEYWLTTLGIRKTEETIELCKLK